MGPKEFSLIQQSDWTAFPPRLPDQPIFYPVLTFDYAEKISRDWNSTRVDAGYLGFVVAFDIANQLAARYPAEVAGGRAHQELWVPAEELAGFNNGIIGRIRLVARYERGRRID
ncbi:MAG: hypothetical protein ACREEE_16110 [Dongiaceae bacterium]